MAKMAEVVNRDTTAVDGCFAGLERFEVFGAIAQAVCEAQWQSSDQALQGGYGPPTPEPAWNRLISALLLPICCLSCLLCCLGWLEAVPRLSLHDFQQPVKN